MKVRTLVRALGAMTVLLGLVVGWTAWKAAIDTQSVGREHFYARAANEALARQAGAATPALLYQSLPPLPGFETAPREAPCPLTTAQLRASGVGPCYRFVIGIVPQRDEPAICRLTPCVFIGLRESDWRRPDTRAALLSLKHDPAAPCRAARSEPDLGWRGTAGALAGDCSNWRWLKGPIFLALWSEAPDIPDKTPPQMSNPAYRFVRLL